MGCRRGDSVYVHIVQPDTAGQVRAWITACVKITLRASSSRPLNHPLLRKVWEGDRTALLNRTEFVGGDFFKPATIPEAEPAGRDVYVMRAVLHDWPDKEAQQILVNVRTAIGVRGIGNCMAEMPYAGGQTHMLAARPQLQTLSLLPPLIMFLLRSSSAARHRFETVLFCSTANSHLLTRTMGMYQGQRRTRRWLSSKRSCTTTSAPRTCPSATWSTSR